MQCKCIQVRKLFRGISRGCTKVVRRWLTFYDVPDDVRICRVVGEKVIVERRHIRLFWVIICWLNASEHRFCRSCESISSLYDAAYVLCDACSVHMSTQVYNIMICVWCGMLRSTMRHAAHSHTTFRDSLASFSLPLLHESDACVRTYVRVCVLHACGCFAGRLWRTCAHERN